ncbi:hypothetical protein M2D07_015800 [Pseudomonas sp. BGr12]|uniref:hypothetical protein n=1 Tax=Pseudomonas sp. BGr12 TaxID=2936269 RepID=UPI0025595CF2|nr:hypothetical protein [Pseudomonas sp. BJa5]MDL2428483.1 hypothetical protein [Pseudomonas sp. BJa5]
MESKFPQVRELMSGRRFALAAELRDCNAQTVFEFSVENDEIWGSFRGGRIAMGQTYGLAKGHDSLELLYYCTTTDGEEFAGWSRGKVTVDDEGIARLELAWGWLAAATGGDAPSYVELIE